MKTVVTAIVSLLLFPLIVFAHAVGLEAKIVGENVVVEVFFDDDTPAQKAKVRIEDGAKAVIAQGVTDEKGTFTFAKPKAGTYRIIVDAGAGHATKSTLEITETPVPMTDEPTRDEFTGWQRYGKAAIGIAVIVVLSLLGRMFLKPAQKTS
jgi:uncharacterized GH25 family protein